MKKIILMFGMVLMFCSMSWAQNGFEKATFAGGCFWCMEAPFESIEGVHEVVSGYTGGDEKNPTYKQVSAGKTSHIESVEIAYDPSKVTYEMLLDIFWRNINPTTADRQFVDVGSQYRTAIFYHSDQQKKSAIESKNKLEASNRYGGKLIVTEIVPAKEFYEAEEYHQDYYKKSPWQYKIYRFNSGRDQYLNKIWKDDPLFQSLKH